MKCKQALPRVSRYQQDGFDLDLTYVTNRVIATSFPSTGLWSLYRFVGYGDNSDLTKMKILFVNSCSEPPILPRNPIEKVSAFLDAKHKDRFWKRGTIIFLYVLTLAFPQVHDVQLVQREDVRHVVLPRKSRASAHRRSQRAQSSADARVC